MTTLRRVGWWVDDHINWITGAFDLILLGFALWFLVDGYRAIRATHPELEKPIGSIVLALIWLGQVYTHRRTRP